jgi:hypothetical protein
VRHFSPSFTYNIAHLHPKSVFSHRIILLDTPFHSNVSELHITPMPSF